MVRIRKKPRLSVIWAAGRIPAFFSNPDPRRHESLFSLRIGAQGHGV
jgi:hypothetical protein